MKICFVGLGKLGRPIAERLSKTEEVVGYDIAEVDPPPRVRMAETLEEAARGSDMVMVAVPTPHDPDYSGNAPVSMLMPRDFDYAAVKETAAKLSAAGVTAPMVLISTVLPGSLHEIFDRRPLPFEVIYNPFFVAMGQVDEDFMDPDIVVVGTRDGARTKAVDALLEVYWRVGMLTVDPTLSLDDRVAVVRWGDAECIKVFYNTFISTKIAFANTVMDACANIDGAHADVVMKWLTKSTKRIVGPAYMTPGSGDGGPCHPRDNIAMSSFALKYGLGYDFFGGITEAREHQAEAIAVTAWAALTYGDKDGIGPETTAVIVGRSYKPGVSLTDGSYSELIAHYLALEGFRVEYHDYMTGDFPPVDLDPKNGLVYIIAHKDAWRTCPIPDGSIVIDLWRTMPNTPGIKVLRYGDSYGTCMTSSS